MPIPDFRNPLDLSDDPIAIPSTNDLDAAGEKLGLSVARFTGAVSFWSREALAGRSIGTARFVRCLRYWSLGPAVDIMYRIVDDEPIGDPTRVALAGGKWAEQVIGYGGVLNALAYGALAPADKNFSDSAALQSMFDVFDSMTDGRYECFIPAGTYSISETVYLPVGIVVRGSGGINETSTGGITRLNQVVAQDIFRFKSNVSGGRSWWHGEITDMSFWGDVSAATPVHAINFKTDANDLVTPADTSVIARITARQFTGSPLNFTFGALPLSVRDAKFLYNNAPGITFRGGSDYYGHQGVHFENISGDANNGGVICLKEIGSTGTILITNLKSEMRVNVAFGGAEHQQNAIVIDSAYENATIDIRGISHISSIPDGGEYKKPGDAISVIGSNKINLVWSAVVVRVRTNDTGIDPNIIVVGGRTVPYTERCGYILNHSTAHRTFASGYHDVYGPIDNVQNVGVEGPSKQIAGITPGRSFYNTTEGLNNDSRKTVEYLTGTGIHTFAWTNAAGVTTIVSEWLRSTAGAIQRWAVRGAVQATKILARGGTVHTTAAVALSGWGSGAAVAGSGENTDQRGRWVITAGASPSANPTLSVTFQDPINNTNKWVVAPIVLASIGSQSTGVAAFITAGARQDGSVVLTYRGTPVEGQTYIIDYIAMG